MAMVRNLEVVFDKSNVMGWVRLVVKIIYIYIYV